MPLTAAVVLTALQAGHVGPGRTALDLGCGTGMLACAAALVGTDHVWGVDCDAAALAVAAANADMADVLESVDFVQARVKDLSSAKTTTAAGQRGGGGIKGGGGRRGGRGGRGRAWGPSRGAAASRASTTEARDLILADDDGLPLSSNCVDTVLCNPPFGTKSNAGMDLRFLRTATRLARHAVYSFHKSSTRDFLGRLVQSSWGMDFRVMAEMKFDLPQTYTHHTHKSVDIAVDLIRVLVHTPESEGPFAPLGEGNAEEVEEDKEGNQEDEDDELLAPTQS